MIIGTLGMWPRKIALADSGNNIRDYHQRLRGFLNICIHNLIWFTLILFKFKIFEIWKNLT